jgi:hypothetical protein
MVLPRHDAIFVGVMRAGAIAESLTNSIGADLDQGR